MIKLGTKQMDDFQPMSTCSPLFTLAPEPTYTSATMDRNAHDDMSVSPLPFMVDFNLDGIDNETFREVKYPMFQGAQEELLHWHYCLSHFLFHHMQQMAQQGILPQKLAKERTPICSACAYGKATRKPWRTKGAVNKIPKLQITGPGDCISVDKLESTTPGLIAQLKGIPTRARYNSAAIFVDHSSGLSYVQLQKALTSKETVEVKQAFEAFAATHGVTIRHYHADNGRFQDKLFHQAIHKEKQMHSFCGINAHFQNGIAEKRIRDLQDNARTMLLHAQ